MPKLLSRCPVLKEMLESGFVQTLEGGQVPIDSNIPLAYAETLYETVLKTRPLVVLEIGMAFGVASLAILSALRDICQNGKLVSIDPHQTSGNWKGGGVAAVDRAALKESHKLIEDYDFNALPHLLTSGFQLDFAYIDGWHTFDYVLLDWWYLDKMLPVGGVIGFNDCGWPAIDKVIKFVLTHRKYKEMDVGLPMEFAKQGRRRELLRRLTFGEERQWYRRAEDRYFEKVESWEPKWDFFAEF
jgi:predicted O-methyltransferase YrrM